MISKICMIMTLIPSRLQVDNKTAPNEYSEVFLHGDTLIPYPAINLLRSQCFCQCMEPCIYQSINQAPASSSCQTECIVECTVATKYYHMCHRASKLEISTGAFGNCVGVQTAQLLERGRAREPRDNLRFGHPLAQNRALSKTCT